MKFEFFFFFDDAFSTGTNEVRRDGNFPMIDDTDDDDWMMGTTKKEENRRGGGGRGESEPYRSVAGGILPAIRLGPPPHTPKTLASGLPGPRVLAAITTSSAGWFLGNISAQPPAAAVAIGP